MKVPVRLDWTLVIVLILVVVNAAINISRAVDQMIAALLYGTIGIFLTVLVHEIGHVSAGLCFGCEPSHIRLWPLGGVAVIAGMPRRHISRILIALAGPLTHIPMLLIWWALFHGALGCRLGDVGAASVSGIPPDWGCVLDKMNACVEGTTLVGCMDKDLVNSAGGIYQCFGYTVEYMESCSPSRGSSGCPPLQPRIDCIDINAIMSGSCALPSVTAIVTDPTFQACAMKLASEVQECKLGGYCVFDPVRAQYFASGTPTVLMLSYYYMFELNVYMLVFNLLLPVPPLDGATILVSSLLSCGLSQRRVALVALVASVTGLVALFLQIVVFAALSSGRNISPFNLFVFMYLAWHTYKLYKARKNRDLDDHPLFKMADNGQAPTVTVQDEARGSAPAPVSSSAPRGSMFTFGRKAKTQPKITCFTSQPPSQPASQPAGVGHVTVASSAAAANPVRVNPFFDDPTTSRV